MSEVHEEPGPIYEMLVSMSEGMRELTLETRIRATVSVVSRRCRELVVR